MEPSAQQSSSYLDVLTHSKSDVQYRLYNPGVTVAALAPLHLHTSRNQPLGLVYFVAVLAAVGVGGLQLVTWVRVTPGRVRTVRHGYVWSTQCHLKSCSTLTSPSPSLFVDRAQLSQSVKAVKVTVLPYCVHLVWNEGCFKIKRVHVDAEGIDALACSRGEDELLYGEQNSKGTSRRMHTLELTAQPKLH